MLSFKKDVVDEAQPLLVAENPPSLPESSIGNYNSVVDTNTVVERIPLRRVWFNAMYLNISIFLSYIAVGCVMTLQSSIHTVAGLGVGAMTLAAAFGIVGSFSSASLIRRIGSKWTLILGLAATMPYVAANFYASWWTFAPSASLAGASMGFSNVAQRTYLARLVDHYAEQIRADPDRIQSRFFAANMIFYKMSIVVGGLASSGILGNAEGNSTVATSDDLALCGADHCNGGPLEAESGPSLPAGFNLLVWFALGVGALGVLLGSAFLRPLARLGVTEEAKHPDGGATGAFGGTVRQLRNPKVWLLLPMFMMYSGGDAFWNTDFVKGYVTCSIGVENVGYVMIWDGISSLVFCLLFGSFNSRKYRSVPLLMGQAAQLVTVLVLLFWKPGSESLVALSGLTTAWYMGSSMKAALIPALVASVFPSEVVFIFPILYTSFFVGSGVFYVFSALLCMKTKLYIILSWLLVSTIGYIVLELILHHEYCGRGYRLLGGKTIVDTESKNNNL